MIRKLRIKIVLVIVLVAAVMLGVIFGMSYTMTRQDLRAQSLSMMQAIAANPFEPLPPGQSRQVRLPYFVLRTDAFGNLVAIGSTDYDLTDRSFLRAVAAAASASEADIGEIPAYHLRFCRVDGSVIFADISSEQQTLQGLVRSSLLIGGGSDGLFASAVTDRNDGTVVVKVINTSDKTQNVTLSLKGMKQASQAVTTTLTCTDMDAENTLDTPDRIVPLKGTAAVAAAQKGKTACSTLSDTLPAKTFRVYRIKK